MNCSWVLTPEPLLETDFVATYRSVGDPQVLAEPHSMPAPHVGLQTGLPLAQLPPPPPRHGVGGATETGECVRMGPRSCSFGDVQMFSLTPYVVNVTAMNPLGAASRLLPFLLENVSESCGADPPR